MRFGLRLPEPPLIRTPTGSVGISTVVDLPGVGENLQVRSVRSASTQLPSNIGPRAGSSYRWHHLQAEAAPRLSG